MDNFYEIEFLKALLFTVSIETIVLLILVKVIPFFKKYNISNLKIIFTGILSSFATLPYVWFIFPAFIFDQNLYIMTSESFAVITETLIFRHLLKLKFKNSLLLSLACNMISFAAGLIFF